MEWVLKIQLVIVDKLVACMKKKPRRVWMALMFLCMRNKANRYVQRKKSLEFRVEAEIRDEIWVSTVYKWYLKP